MKKFVFIIVVLTNWILLFSQTSIPAGNVTGTWNISGSPYLIEGNIIISVDDELIIEPGVSIIFQDHYNLLVNGCLQAIGTISDSIYFTATDTTYFSIPDSIYTGWNGIVIDNSENLTPELTKISYCDISYSKRLIDEEFEDRGGAILVMWQAVIEISNNKIHHNMARIGGAICSGESNIYNNLICNNYATSSGGGLFLFSSNVLANNLIIDNKAANSGGGLLVHEALLPICNNTIVNNQSLQGCGLYVSAESSKFYNNIFWGEPEDSEQIYISQINTFPEFYYCNIADGENGFAGANNYIYENNIDTPPYFNTQFTEHPYSLSDSSYCINAGIPDTLGMNLPAYDFGGNNRIFENHIDIGAYEYQQISQIVIPPTFSLPSGTYSGNCILELSCATENAIIYYSSDGSEPDENSTAYTLPIQISETTTIKAKAFKEDFYPSLTSTENYFFGTEINGTISGLLSIALSPYIVSDNLLLESNESLIIEPGVEIYFDGEYEFVINGHLTAIGTETDSILFIAIDHFNGWRGLSFLDSNESSELTHCILSYAKKCDDYSTDNGGAINITNTNYVTIQNCRFHHNFSARGGAIFLSGSNITIENSLFRNNGVRSRGGAICVKNGSNAYISYNRITNNLGSDGAGICFDSATGIVENNWICSNYGSTIKVQFGTPTFTGNIIANNRGYGNGIAFNLEDFSNVDIVNCTIVDNYATNSSNYNEAIYCVYATNPTISNTILFNPGIRELYAEQSVVNSYPFLNYCLVEGGDAGFNHSVVIDEDPLFNTSAGAFPYELSEDSPCIDFGTDNIGGYNFPETDFLGNERFWDGDGNGSVIIDLGVYEFGSEPPVSIEEEVIQTPPSIQLKRNYPNPFNPETKIDFSISEDCKTNLSVYNIKGQLVKILINADLEKGNHDIIWFGRNNNNEPVSSGVYFYKLKVNNKIEAVKKCLLLK